MGQSQIWSGVAAGLPIALGYFPIAFSFGVGAVRMGLSAGEAVVMSLLMYSGAAQFLAVSLIAASASSVVIFVSLVAMSLRHILYGPSLLRRAGEGATTRFGAFWGFGLTDEVFGAALSAMVRGQRFSEGFMSILSGFAYASWVAGTAVGAYAGSGVLGRFPAIEAGLGFMLAALFLALLLSVLRRGEIPVMLVSMGVMLVFGAVFSPTIGLLSGIMAGAVLGALMYQGRGVDAE